MFHLHFFPWGQGLKVWDLNRLFQYSIECRERKGDFLAVKMVFGQSWIQQANTVRSTNFSRGLPILAEKVLVNVGRTQVHQSNAKTRGSAYNKRTSDEIATCCMHCSIQLAILWSRKIIKGYCFWKNKQTSNYSRRGHLFPRTVSHRAVFPKLILHRGTQ